MTFFTDNELKCKCCGQMVLAEGFLDKLNELRYHFGKPMRVNSGCRCYAHNMAIGGHPNSAHVFDHPKRPLKGSYAVDIHCANSEDRFRLVALAYKAGWCVGVNKTFVHLDRRRDYYLDYPKVMFLY